MEILGFLRRQFDYDAWANREVFAALKSTGSESRSVRLLAHIVSAERLWLERIAQQPQTLPVWPDFTLEQCGGEIDDVSTLWREFLDRCSETQLSGEIHYKNSKGELWTSSVEDILAHVLLHSAYHRGQIATQMRAEGRKPASTDFIHAVRLKLIE